MGTRLHTFPMDEDWRSQDFDKKSLAEIAIICLWIAVPIMAIVVPLIALLLD